MEKTIKDDHDLLIRIEYQLEQVGKELNEWKIMFKTVTDDHEKRLRDGEKSRWFIAGGSAVVGTLLSHFVRLLN